MQRKRVVGIVEDITDRKEAQLQLHEILEARDRHIWG